MSSFVTSLRLLVRLCGVVLIILGLCFWAGYLRGLINAHMLIGLLLAVALLALAVIAAAKRVSAGLVALAVVLAIGMPLFGMAQTRIMPGSGHWVIQVLHLLIGMAAIGTGEQLAVRLTRAAASPARA